MNSKPIQILLVEDNPADVKLTKIAFEKLKVVNKLDVVNDGIEALSYLKHEDAYSQAPTPDLILLDLNLPCKSGCEVLIEIKNDPELKIIPVIILTTSKEDQDVLETYNNHANGFIVKPVDFEGLLTIVRSIEDFWFNIVKLPPH